MRLHSLMMIVLVGGLVALSGCKSLEELSAQLRQGPPVTIGQPDVRGPVGAQFDVAGEQPKEQLSALDLADRELLRHCPEVNLVDDLSELHQFREEADYNEDEKIAWVTLSHLNNHCVVDDGQLAVNLTMSFEANLGPKSRIFDQDQPTISYPYFIAVTDANGRILDKEIHGVSLSFDADQSRKQHKENLQKIVFLDEEGAKPPYSIMVGFQLSPDELAYNQINRGKLLAPIAGKKPKPFS